MLLDLHSLGSPSPRLDRKREVHPCKKGRVGTASRPDSWGPTMRLRVSLPVREGNVYPEVRVMRADLQQKPPPSRSELWGGRVSPLPLEVPLKHSVRLFRHEDNGARLLSVRHKLANQGRLLFCGQLSHRFRRLRAPGFVTNISIWCCRTTISP